MYTPTRWRVTMTVGTFALYCLSYGALAATPPGAQQTLSGSQLRCEPGFRDARGECEAIDLPNNAYLTGSRYGTGWACKRGYKAQGKRCVAMVVPANGYLDASGTSWKCHRGYQQKRERCDEIQVPENGYLNGKSYGRGWDCERGYRQVEALCEEVDLPDNAHLNYLGNDWECDPPFRRVSQQCIHDLTLPDAAAIENAEAVSETVSEDAP